MGSFYSNLALKTNDTDDVVDTLTQASRTGFVASAGEWVVVYDAQCDDQDADEVELVGTMLSRQHRCVGFAVMNHDDDILVYWLFDKGEIIDTYNSRPDYFDSSADADQGGDVELLCRTLGKPQAVHIVRKILYEDEFMFESERHAALCQALELPLASVGTGFRHLEEDGLPDGISEDQLRRVE